MGEEAKRLDEKWTKSPPKPGPNETGYFIQCKKTAQIIGEMVQELIAASVKICFHKNLRGF